MVEGNKQAICFSCAVRTYCSQFGMDTVTTQFSLLG